MKELSILPGEGPPTLGRCNYDSESPKRSSNVAVKGRGSADEAVVVVKLEADEDTVTYLRIKLSASGVKLEAKGGTC